MKKLSLFYLILHLFCQSCFSQKIRIEFTDNNEPISFINITDSIKKITLSTGVHNFIELPNLPFNLLITHVAYKPLLLAIPIVNNDTLLLVKLQKKIVTNDEVTISTNLKKPKLQYKKTNFNYKSNGLVRLNKSLKIGFFLKNDRPNEKQTLEELILKIKKNKDVIALNEFIQVNFFEIDEANFLFTLINTKPIILNCKEFYNKVKIIPNEKIWVPQNGIFVSLEMPKLSYLDKDLFFDFICELKTGIAPLRTNGNHLFWSLKHYFSKGIIPINQEFGFSPLFKAVYNVY